MKTLLIALLMVCGMAPSAFAGHPANVDRSLTMDEIYDTLDVMNSRHRNLNVGLVRLQFSEKKSRKLWTEDLIKLSSVLEENKNVRPGEIETLSCNKIVCREIAR